MLAPNHLIPLISVKLTEIFFFLFLISRELVIICFYQNNLIPRAFTETTTCPRQTSKVPPFPRNGEHAWGTLCSSSKGVGIQHSADEDSLAS